MPTSTPFYIVATPIGNRDDITTRALQVLGEADFIVAEDTRHTGQLLALYGIKKPFISFRDAPKPVMERTLESIRERLQEGKRGVYVTDAGTPGVSDPAWRLVDMLLGLGVTVTPVPGPAAVTALISVAGVQLDEYRFVGFLPKKKGHQSKLEDIALYLEHKEARGVVFYESPKRVRKTLAELGKLNINLRLVIGRELTKKFETIYRISLSDPTIPTLPEKGEYAVLLYNDR